MCSAVCCDWLLVSQSDVSLAVLYGILFLKCTHPHVSEDCVCLDPKCGLVAEVPVSKLKNG